MKVKIEIDMTPEEAKELFVPSEKQAEFGSQLYEQWLASVQKSIMEAYNPMNNVKNEDKSG